MIKIKAMYSTEDDKNKLLQTLRESFKVIKVSKEYIKEGPCKRIYINLQDE